MRNICALGLCLTVTAALTSCETKTEESTSPPARVTIACATNTDGILSRLALAKG